jgi:hypothetical protein
LTLLQTTSKLSPGIPLSARWKRPPCTSIDFCEVVYHQNLRWNWHGLFELALFFMRWPLFHAPLHLSTSLREFSIDRNRSCQKNTKLWFDDIFDTHWVA